jgi:hypothetical protein
VPLIRCDAPIRKIGRWTIVRLPADGSAKLPSRGQVAVEGTLNGQSFQAVLEPDGRRGHWLKIDTTLRGAVALGVGDSATLEIELAKDWPEPAVPSDFRSALADAPDAGKLWKSITPMARWEWVRWINATKNPDTRARRVRVGISKLQSGKRRPCCFDLTACTDPDLSKSGKLLEAD